MADYKDIIGTAVRNNAGNLSDDQKDQIFYDSTNLDFKYRISNVTSVGAWRTAGNLNTALKLSSNALIMYSLLLFLNSL